MTGAFTLAYWKFNRNDQAINACCFRSGGGQIQTALRVVIGLDRLKRSALAICHDRRLQMVSFSARSIIVLHLMQSRATGLARRRPMDIS